MRGVNKVIVIGNLGMDVELRQLANGKPVWNLGVIPTLNQKEKNMILRPFFTRSGLACLVAVALLAGPAMAQEQSDEGLRQEMERLIGYQREPRQGTGYRGRVMSSDYELEFQMQQLDKQRKSADLKRIEALRIERDERQRVRKVAAQQRQQAERDAAYQQSIAQFDQWMKQVQDRNDAMEKSSYRMQQKSARLAAQNRAQSAEGVRISEWMLQQAREETRRNSQGLPTLPTLPGSELMYPPPDSGPSVPGAYFPDVDEVMGRR